MIHFGCRRVGTRISNEGGKGNNDYLRPTAGDAKWVVQASDEPYMRRHRRHDDLLRVGYYRGSEPPGPKA